MHFGATFQLATTSSSAATHLITTETFINGTEKQRVSGSCIISRLCSGGEYQFDKPGCAENRHKLLFSGSEIDHLFHRLLVQLSLCTVRAWRVGGSEWESGRGRRGVFVHGQRGRAGPARLCPQPAASRAHRHLCPVPAAWRSLCCAGEPGTARERSRCCLTCPQQGSRVGAVCALQASRVPVVTRWGAGSSPTRWRQ